MSYFYSYLTDEENGVLEVKFVTQDHTTSKEQSQDWNLSSLAPERTFSTSTSLHLMCRAGHRDEMLPLGQGWVGPEAQEL